MHFCKYLLFKPSVLNPVKLYNRQFILNKIDQWRFNWPVISLGEYYLHRHPELECEVLQFSEHQIILLGHIFDSAFPQRSNRDILVELSKTENLKSFIDSQNNFGGHYTCFLKFDEKLFILNDAAAQSEVFYKTDFTVFASQIALMREFEELELSDDQEIKNFYSSAIFKKQAILIGDTTPYEGIYHLRPNHYLDLQKRIQHRFFPDRIRTELSTKEVAKQAAQMIKGFVEAIIHRHKSVLAVTAGYDSRILFLASLDADVKYYVSRHPSMTDEHYDIKIPKALCQQYSKAISVISDSELEDETREEYKQSIDFLRARTGRSGEFKGSFFINGNISEVARNYYGRFTKLSGSDLAYLNHFDDLILPQVEFEKWLSNYRSEVSKFEFNELDLFYWEERLGNWGAKAKTEWAVLGDVLLSPFNCRNLLSLMLSSSRNDRDTHDSILYNQIILNLSKDGLNLPINPGKKERLIRFMKKFGLYNMYRKIGLKYRFLKV